MFVFVVSSQYLLCIEKQIHGPKLQTASNKQFTCIKFSKKVGLIPQYNKNPDTKHIFYSQL